MSIVVRSSPSQSRGTPLARYLERFSLGSINAIRFDQALVAQSNGVTSSPLAQVGTPIYNNIDTFLVLAIHLATALQEIHQQQISHGAINPATILLETEPTETIPYIRVHILESGAAAERGLDTQLPYLAPEQTGRMNRSIDHRTDLYALGVIYYQMLTGRLPFVAQDPLSLVHAHIATKPTPPVQLYLHLPSPLSEMVLKLLAKDPQDRYQSAQSLLADLQKCQAAWQTSGQVEPFPLGQTDISERLLLPEKPMGRRHELDQLVDALADVHQGNTRFFLLTGDSGIGKTALVGELLPSVIARGGVMLTHRADSQEQNIPFAAAIGLLQDFVQQLLAGEPLQVAQWRERLAAALVGHTTQLIRYIPELGLLLGAPSDSHAETSDPTLLLNLALQNFLTAITGGVRPLLLFVDDAQRADTDSLRLLQHLSNNRLPVMVIWACRHDELMSDYLQTTIATVPGTDQLHLTPLDFAATSHFLAETLHTTVEQVHDLAYLIHTKTGGNPFFLRQLVYSLHEQALIFFDFQERVWRWHLAQIQATPIADNVVDVVQDRLNSLPESTQKLLKVAAYMGGRFEPERLATVLQETSVAIEHYLRHALNLGIIMPLFSSFQVNPPTEPRAEAMQQIATHLGALPGQNQPGQRHGDSPAEAHTAPPLVTSPGYQFAHEQIRNAAAHLLPSLNEDTIHEQIGWRLWHSMTPAQRQENAFLLVSHLNQTALHEAAWPNRVTVAHLNLQAGRQAMALMAYGNALSFSQLGIAWLGQDSGWQEANTLMGDLHLIAAQASARLGQFSQTDCLLDTIEGHATSVLERVAVIQERMLVFYLQGKHEAAVAAALSALRQLGVYLPQQPGRRHLALALIRTQLALIRRSPETLATLPPMTHENSHKVIEVIAAATLSAAAANPNLLMLMGLEIMRQTLKHGSHPLSAMGYALYAVLLCGVTGQIEPGYAFGQLALHLSPQIKAREYRVFVKYFIHAHVFHWRDHIQATLQPLRDIPTTGEFEYFAVAAGLYPYFTWFINSMDLSSGEKAIAENMHLLEPFKNTPIYYRYQLGQQYYRNLLGLPDDPCQMVGAVYDEREMLPLHLAENDQATIFYLACHKLTLCYLFGEYEQATVAAQLALTHNQGGIGTPLVPVLVFYDSLARLALVPTRSGREVQQLLKIVANNQRKMRRWAKHSPANCLHRFTLVAAEEARVRGENSKARELYDTAIRHAQTHNFLPELALAHEAAAQFYLNLEQSAYAEYHLRQSYQQYQTWGALGKLRQIEHRFPHLFSNNPAADTKPFAGLSAHLDMTTVLKAAQILSRETDLARLIDTLTAILMENAGAQYGTLLLPEGNQWRVVSHQPAADREEIQPDQTVAAMSLVWQVARTREPIWLNDVTAAATLTYDPHLQQAQPRSLLCLPLLNEGELVAVLYLENRLTRHAFPPERLPLLTMLTGQAAISLKNARLVAGLQEAQAKIQVSEQRFRLLFENAPLGILEIDIAAAAPQILTVNRRAEALYGWSAPEFAALDPLRLIPEANRQEMQHLVEAVRAGKTATLESRNQRRDGTIFPVRIIATPAPQQHNLHMIIAVEDITAQQQRRSEVAAIEEERRRIAQEIHDGVAQNLAFLRLKMALWHDWVVSDPARTQAELQQTQILLDDTIVEIRRSIYALRPLALDTMGLVPVLRGYIADFNEQHKVYVTLQIDIQEEHLSPDHELLLFRVIQEALNNIVQHAQASLAWVNLTLASDQAITLTIRDNGQGFDVASLNRSGRSGHLGLLQMRERTEQAGGHFMMTSQPGEGTAIILRFL
jgi:PAS domain S-box-containing protein